MKLIDWCIRHGVDFSMLNCFDYDKGENCISFTFMKENKTFNLEYTRLEFIMLNCNGSAEGYIIEKLKKEFADVKA